MNARWLVLVIAFGCMPPQIAGSDESAVKIAVWEPVAAPLSPHRYHAMVSLAGKVYTVGGESTSMFERYDPRDDAWRELPRLPTPRMFLAAAAIGQAIYALGGADPSQTSLAIVEEYNTSRNTWRRRAPMPKARDRFAAVAVDGKILVLGGFSSNQNLDLVDVYDPLTDRWSDGPKLPLARHGHSAVATAGKIFVLGGYGTSGDVVVAPLARVDELDVRTGVWTRRADLPQARGFFAAVAIGDFLYTMGGRTRRGSPVERYNITTDTWEVLGDMPSPRQRFGAATVDGRVIIVGGEDSPDDALAYNPG